MDVPPHTNPIRGDTTASSSPLYVQRSPLQHQPYSIPIRRQRAPRATTHGPAFIQRQQHTSKPKCCVATPTPRCTYLTQPITTATDSRHSADSTRHRPTCRAQQTSISCGSARRIALFVLYSSTPAMTRRGADRYFVRRTSADIRRRRDGRATATATTRTRDIYYCTCN